MMLIVEGKKGLPFNDSKKKESQMSKEKVGYQYGQEE
jgi:hypothetical protein